MRVPPLRPLALAGALVLVGCGGDGGSSTGRGDTASAATTAASSQTDPQAAPAARLRLQRIGSFTSPLYVTAPPGDRSRIFVVEQGGRIRVVRGGRVLSRPFLDISRDVVSGGEQGLLGLAFAPDYARSGLFYVNYTNRSGDTRIVEYRVRNPGDDVADPGTARVVLAQNQPEVNHNGGQLAFGPDDLLYIGLGDGGGANDRHGRLGNAQSLGSLLGKILRIDPRAQSGSRAYGIPSSNPFVSRAGARPEVYSYGLRNPWRFSFDRRSGALTIGDVGQNEIEELTHVGRGAGRGANFGWRPWEGRNRIYPGERAPGAIFPSIQKRHSAGWCSITGGYVVRDRSVPSLYGRYVYGDYCQGRLRAVRFSGRRARSDRALPLRRIGSLSSFGEDARGRVYVVSLDGPVYRFVQ
jgi:glucose/arabinose dehydrogenase